MGWTAIAVGMLGIVVAVRAWPRADARRAAWAAVSDAFASLRSTASAALVIGLLAAMGVGAYALDGPSVAARCATTTALADVLSDQEHPSGPAAEELYRRLRCGDVAPADLADVVRTLWTLRLGYDQTVEAGQAMNVNVALVPPALGGVADPLGPGAPRLRWRWAEVRVGDAPAARPACLATDGPLPRFETSAWQPVAFAATLPPGPVMLRCRVDFELRDGDASPTRWTQWLEQSITVERPVTDECATLAAR